MPGGNSNFGLIDANGVYHPPAFFPTPNTMTVTASSQADPTKTAAVSATIVYPNDNAAAQTFPIKLGTAGGNGQDVSFSGNVCCTGTLGSLVMRDGLPYILSNSHVLARSSFGVNGEAINQPGPAACFASTSTVATLSFQSTITPVSLADNQAVSNVDAALAAVAPGAVDLSGNILDLGLAGPTSIAAAPPSATLANALIGQPVAKSGRTTGLTCSSITAFNATMVVDYNQSCSGAPAFSSKYVGQMVIAGTAFAAPGDSGALVVTTDQARPVGMLFAGNGTNTLAHPIADVISEFSVHTQNPGPIIPSIVGGPDHQIFCAPTSSVPSDNPPGAFATVVPALSASEHARVAAVHRDHAVELMQDASVSSVSIGASNDSPGEGALVIHVNSSNYAVVPALIDGVRTRVVLDSQAVSTGIAVAQSEIDRARLAKESHTDELLAKPGVHGIGVAFSKDNPAEAAVVVFVTRGVQHPPIPAVLDGVRTQIVEGERFRAY